MSQRVLVGLFVIVTLLVVIMVFRSIQGDPEERMRINPESRPKVELGDG